MCAVDWTDADSYCDADMAAYEDRCANVGFDAKSVRITCEERPQSELTSTLPPLPTIMSVPDDEVETITMVPKKQRHRVCYWDNELPSDQQGFDQATQTITMVPAAASSSSPSSPITWLPNDQEGEDDD